MLASEEGMIRIYALDAKTLLQEGQRRIDATLTPVDCDYYGSIVCSTSPEIAVREGP